MIRVTIRRRPRDRRVVQRENEVRPATRQHVLAHARVIASTAPPDAVNRGVQRRSGTMANHHYRGCSARAYLSSTVLPSTVMRSARISFASVVFWYPSTVTVTPAFNISAVSPRLAMRDVGASTTSHVFSGVFN